MVLHHPLGQDGAAAADDAGDAARGQRDVLHQHAGVNGHVVDALLGLFLDDFEHQRGAEILEAAHAGECFVNGHGSDGHGRVVDDGLADARDVAAGGEIHDRIGAVLHRVAQLFEFLIDVGGDRGVADVGVDFALGGDPDGHGFEVGVAEVGGDDHAAARHLGADGFGRKVFALRDVLHFAGDDAAAGVVHLCANCVVLAFGYPFFTHVVGPL